MVQFSNLQHTLTSSRSLRQVIESVLEFHQADLRELSISIEREVDWQVAELVCQPQVENCLRELLHSAIARSTLNSQLTISACRTGRGIAIEIADADSVTDDLPTNAFSRCQAWASQGSRSQAPRWRNATANATAPDVYHTRCPQGGQAWTLVMTPRLAQVRAA